MYKICTLNKISNLGLDRMDKAQFEIGEDVAGAQGILLRSADMHAMEIDPALLAVGRAGAGTNNIPIDAMSEQGVVVFNTPGANANAVKELVILGLLISSRNVYDGIGYAYSLKGKGDEVGKLVEKGKGQFVGPEIKGKTLGVIGLGAIGVMVANIATHLGMTVYGYDPFISVDNAWGLNRRVVHAASIDEIYANSDYISLHLPLNGETRGMIGADAINTMKDDVRILNFARGELVDDTALISALESGKVAAYVTDFPSDAVIGVKGVVPIPHLGASTPESEDNCAVMAADQLSDYLLYGNIKNSVNLPDVEMAKVGDARICVFHKNIPTMLSQISTAVGEAGINIENMLNKSKNDYAYTIIDVSGAVADSLVSSIQDIDGVIRVRVI